MTGPEDARERQQAARYRELMRLFHAGDCRAITAWLGEPDRTKSEVVYAAFLLDLLGDPGARARLVAAFPNGDHPGDGIHDPSEHLDADEGCAPALCMDGNEPECRPWFGTHAGPGCIPTEYGATPGCMPAFCREPHEMLIEAARQRWPGAVAALVAQAAQSDGYVWGTLCYCALRAFGTQAEWLASATTREQRAALADCFGERGNGPSMSCQRPSVAAGQARSCGTPSAKSTR